VSLLASSVRWIWGLSILLQLGLFTLLFWKRDFRRLPILTTYVALNLCQAAFLLFLYSRPGASFETLKDSAWISEAATLLFQALAAMEAIRLVLKPYEGIWGLAWRLLATICVVLVALIVKHAAGDYNWAILEADRGYHFVFAAAVVACFLIIRYYSVAVPAPYKILLAGFCFYSCTTILATAFFQWIWWGSSANYETIWQFITVFSFAVVQVTWVAALRKPLPAPIRPMALSSNDIYEQLSPEIDQRLRLLNQKLMRVWKLEARSQ
jgi:hypothetical protein